MCLGIAWTFLLAMKYLPNRLLPESPYEVVAPALVAVCFALLAFAAFRLKYGRSYTYGFIQGISGGKAVVKVGYDLCSNVKPGVYLVEGLGRLKVGDEVKIGVERSTLSLRGARVKMIMEKISRSSD
jgi:uncharacterized membrane protein